MSRFIDLTGQKFGKLTVLKRAEDHIQPSGKHAVQWLCKCDCGNEIVTLGDSLKSGHTKSCGCLQQEVTKMLKEINTKSNVYNLINQDYGIGYTFKGEEFYFDLEDYDKIKDYCWFVNDKGYIVARIRGSNKYAKLHRVILNCTERIPIDHKGGENTRNDNRKSNLRICTYSQNGMNRGVSSNNISGVTGVSWHKQHNKWEAYITVDRKQNYLGLFDTFEDAVKARKKAEEKYFGEWSHDNSQKGII